MKKNVLSVSCISLSISLIFFTGLSYAQESTLRLSTSMRSNPVETATQPNASPNAQKASPNVYAQTMQLEQNKNNNQKSLDKATSETHDIVIKQASLGKQTPQTTNTLPQEAHHKINTTPTPPTQNQNQESSNAAQGIYQQSQEVLFQDTAENNDTPLTIVESDLWGRMRNGFAIPNLENQFVDNQTLWYGSRPDYLMRTIQRGSKYLYHVIDALERRGMPTDLALLPFIESAFNPNAISTAKASGMWQFMPGTGRDFQLRQSVFKDDRRGVLDSTEAALNYLQKLYSMFGNWHFALSAYNWGEGSVQRAIKKAQSMGLTPDYANVVQFMPLETKNYVPKLQAVKNIIANPTFYGIELPRLENTPYFTSIRKTKDIDITLAAKLAGISLSEFKSLNPQFSRPVITASSKTPLLLPIENAKIFQSNLEKYEGPLSSWTAYQLNKTDKVENLAKRFGMRPEALREVNAIPPKMLVKSGSTILIPKSENGAKSGEQNIPEKLAEDGQLSLQKAIQTKKISIKVGKRDTLASLAKRYKVSITDIQSWNHVKGNNVKSGQKLVLHVPYTPKARHASRHSGKHHTKASHQAKHTTGKTPKKRR